MKKLLAMLLALTLVFAFAACGGSNEISDKDENSDIADIPDNSRTESENNDASADGKDNLSVEYSNKYMGFNNYAKLTLALNDGKATMVFNDSQTNEGTYTATDEGITVTIENYDGPFSTEFVYDPETNTLNCELYDNMMLFPVGHLESDDLFVGYFKGSADIVKGTAVFNGETATVTITAGSDTETISGTYTLNGSELIITDEDGNTLQCVYTVEENSKYKSSIYIEEYNQITLNLN